MKYSVLDDFSFYQKRVLIRTGFDVPLDDDGNITDYKRINISIPTINYLLEKDASKIIIMFHMGRPKEREARLSTTNVAKRLGELLGQPVAKVDDWGENGFPDERIVVLENVRFHPGEKSKDEAQRDAFAYQLSQIADLFVMDAFSNMHHPEQASMTGVMKYRQSCLGLSSQKEIETLTEALKSPKRPLVSIIGGVKAEKLNAVHALMHRVDKILIAGALGFTIQKAMGYEMGASKIDNEGMESMKDLIKELIDNPKIILPRDATIAKWFDHDADSKVVPIENIEHGWMALDIGPETIDDFKMELIKAKTIIWNGPIGVFEFQKFATGTIEIANILADSDAYVIIGGGDSADAVNKLGLSDKMSFVSTGGGASLMMFEGKTLPVLEHLHENYKRFKE